jgi:hypothetical protein
MVRYIFLLLFFAPTLRAQIAQIAIPRVEQMPNLPAPYNLRDWKNIALRYDSFAYDITKTGQYLPLVSLQSSGVNYPQNPAFGLHTYVGTNTPNGNEAINVLPSIVGASLCGADKTVQFGHDWVQMSQDFFSKNDGTGIYLNNKGGGSGSDWWYDLMPNVYFYQICALYPPPPGSETEAQFLSVADKFLASVRALGGSETPWQKGNFDYRAFNFQTMQPNPNGVHEPEAAGAYASVLYHAYQKTGNEDYRKGAEWALEFLQDWQVNPSYELQLPYGTLAAARMNAEIGTQYDIEKMLNWSFERGPLRGWGTIVGNWGGFDCSGLVGEANDAGNDYAFQLNGVQQAAALVPLVRYDKRFARAIGKWVLNLANATRLFYPGFLPSNYQDATAWSNTYDPERVVGYEALREKWQGFSPFSTGDAVGGGWAGTNLSLYSTGSIGYLGSIVEKTNVDKILKTDVLKTDFYNNPAYPTYLFFNPFGSAQNIVFDAGAAPADIYDAVSEDFLLTGVNGSVNLSIPANGVLLVTICPAGGVISFEKNKMLVNGVVVDYLQSAQSWQRAPRIQSVAAAQPVVEIGTSVQIFSKTQVGDSPDLDYFWSASGGTLTPAGPGGQWTAPANPGIQTLQLIVLDGNGLSDTATVTLNVVPEINQPPQILEIEKNLQFVAPGGVIQFDCQAADPNGDPLAFEWTFSDGNFTGTGNLVEWTAPNAEGIFEATIKVSDDEGLTDEATVKILVKNFDATTGNLVAHYNFSGNANDLTANQLHGIPFSTTYVSDVFGAPQRAKYFNGVNSRVSVTAQPVLNFQDGITVSTWFRANDLPAKETFLLSHGSWQNRWKISFTPDQKLRWTVNTLDAVGDLDTEIPMTTDSFYHIAATYDGQIMALYLNGKLHAFRFLSGKIRQTNLAFLMGQMLPGNVEYNFKGVLDEVKIFDYALTPDAAQVLYQNSTTGIFPALKNEIRLEVSPNPAREQLRIVAPEPFGTDALLSVYSADGRLVFEQKFTHERSLNLNISSWESGTYRIILTDKTNIGRGVFSKI